ncbi:MAG: hypothetical protein A2Y62_18805 [Candidatus Fischerbacteria bacterium RBG_13_37_8]|uniref:Uncharacterized protein n=1 Tax=Candidatus Fischerbacteria bacterium RBG_13_37_8 TaxID=1817863 RepID=A0A1F5VSR3_9BACT|nr:MAG: hypothetical protein A2Y62_18805 [Candidatus Fischerbacteria bacterium RBG_13_37_8]
MKEIINWKKAISSPPDPEQDAVSHYSYGYDYDYQISDWKKKGYRTSMIENVYGDTPVTRNEQYYYDSLYQLTKSNYADIPVEHSWAYDSIGNRLSQTTAPDSSISYSYYKINSSNNSQLLRHDGSACYIWDKNGNLLCMKAETNPDYCPDEDKPHDVNGCPSQLLHSGDALYTWDKEDRLIHLQWYENGLTHNTYYYYDFNGNRFKKVVDGLTTTYIYHNEDIIKEIGPLTYRYVHGPGIDEPAFLCANDACSNPFYYFADGLGSIRQIVDNSNNSNIENQYRYGSWGELDDPFIRSENINNPFAFTAKEFAENENYFYRWRYYKSYLAKFISKDILLNNPSNAFSYTKNCPLIFIDPYGTQEIKNGCLYEAWRPADPKNIDKTKCKERNRKVFPKWKLVFIRREFIPKERCQCFFRQIGCFGIIKLWCDITCLRNSYPL